MTSGSVDNSSREFYDLFSRVREDPLEEGMETHSKIFAWRSPGTEETGGL